jgi:hypothetical protein
MAHKPPCGWRSVSKLDPIRFKTENTLTKTLDSKVGFMRLLGAVHKDKFMAQKHTLRPVQ